MPSSRLATLILKDQDLITDAEKGELANKLDLIDKISMQIGVLAGQSSVTTINTTTQIGQLSLEKSGVGVAFSGGGLKSEDYTAGSAGWQIEGDGDAEFNDITARGVIYATSGEIAGWTINAANLTKNDATLASAGYLLLGTGNNIVKLDSQDATYRIWVGHATAGSAPFRVEKDGGITATDATITGSITATSGTIGGWTVSGNTLTATGIVLDAGNQKITVGSAAPNIVIDGNNKYIRSSNYTANSSGFNIDGTNGSAEFQNITARGLLKSTVTQTNTQHSTAGTFIVNDASDVLLNDLADDALTIDVKTQTMNRNSMIYMSPEATRKEWIRVTNDGVAITGGYRYTVDRDIEGTGSFAFTAGESVITRGSASVSTRAPMWGEGKTGFIYTPTSHTPSGGIGTTYGWARAMLGTQGSIFAGYFTYTKSEFTDGVLMIFGESSFSFGGTGSSAYGGWVELEGTENSGPYIGIVRRDGPNATDYQSYGRFGRLAGFLDYGATDDIGIGLGEPGDSLSWDKTHGMRITAGAEKTQVTGTYVQMPSLTTTERDGISASNGMLIYNSSTNKLQAYENGAWANII
ncbi:MAG: hypothetical protein QF704_00500 [Anaerolineales bacterium]|nr:hypothetical protein [Anaerolineales bacterium]